MIREGMVIVRNLDGIVKNKYANDPGKLAAWISASHVEKAPKKKETPTPLALLKRPEDNSGKA